VPRIDAARSSGTLPGLLAIAVAVLLWWQADQLHSRRILAGERVAAARQLLRAERTTADPASLRTRRLQLQTERRALEQRLVEHADMGLLRAQLYYDLRERCYAVKLNCLIRLAELEAADRPRGAASDTASDDSMARLGVRRLRATISGLLGEQELQDVLAAFSADEQRVWRFNRVQLKTRAFEIDIERLVQPASGRQ
jgi:hypothetical protein